MFRFIHAEKADHDIATLCRFLKISRSGYYAWRFRPPSARACRDAELTSRIKTIHERSRCTYGSPRIHWELQDEGFRIGRKRVARLMRTQGIRGAYRKRRRGVGRGATMHPASDLVRRSFTTQAPNLVWVADFTYWPTEEGFLYVAAVMDLFSRMIVGWSMSHHLRAEFVIDAIEMATGRRDPAPGLIHHSDQGTQYTSFAFGRRLEQSGILPSMGSTGTPADNAVVESTFDKMKTEILLHRRYATRAQARSAVFEWIEVWYNRQRRHSTLGGINPTEFERRYVSQLLLAN